MATNKYPHKRMFQITGCDSVYEARFRAFTKLATITCWQAPKVWGALTRDDAGIELAWSYKPETKFSVTIHLTDEEAEEYDRGNKEFVTHKQ